MVEYIKYIFKIVHAFTHNVLIRKKCIHNIVKELSTFLYIKKRPPRNNAFFYTAYYENCWGMLCSPNPFLG